MFPFRRPTGPHVPTQDELVWFWLLLWPLGLLALSILTALWQEARYWLWLAWHSG